MAEPGSAAGRGRLERLPRRAAAALRRIGRAAGARGQRAYLVGGAVRDLLLGRPIEDLDVAIEGDAPQLARELARTLRGQVRAHPAFRTATLCVPGGLRIDLASTRRERYPRPAALPEVMPGDLEDDLARRDFTIHALALRLTPPSVGALHDPHGGRADLRARQLRELHPRSYLDDPTRAFRAARFAARLDFRLARGTAPRIVEALGRGVFERLSAARLWREVRLLLEEPAAPRALRWLRRLGLLRVLHPRLEVGRGTYAHIARAQRILGDAQLAGGAPETAPIVLLAVVTETLRGRARGRLLERLRPGRAASRVLRDGPAAVRRIVARLAGRRRSAWQIHAACRGQPREILLWALASSERIVRARIGRYLRELHDVRADVDGHDLLAAGLPAGPAVARALDAALRAKLDRRAAGRDEQLAAALARVRLTASRGSSKH